MICDRCGIANRSGRISCVQCLGPLLNGTAPAAVEMCAVHTDTPALGKCITCQKLVCETCGGVVNNRGVYCMDHTPVLTTGRASPGMNPLLAGADADAALAVPGAAAKRPGVSPGLVMGIGGLVALVLAVVVLLVWPGVLASKPVTPAPVAAGGYGAPGMPGAAGDPYGYGASPYGSGGAMDPAMGGPYGSAGPYGAPGMPPGGPGAPGMPPGVPGPGAAMPGGPEAMK